MGNTGTQDITQELTSAEIYSAEQDLDTKVADYELVLADAGKLIEMNSGSANEVTVPANADVAFPIGTRIDICQYGAGVTSIVAAGGVTINATPGLNLRAQFSAATLVKRATNEWYLYGDLSS